MKKVFGFSLALLLLAGCAVKEVPPTISYTLAAETPAIERSTKAPLFKTLRVVVKHDSRLSATKNIYYLEKGFALQPYAYHCWYDTPASLLEKKLQLALSKAGIARSVTDSTTPIPSDAMLYVEVAELWQDFSHGTPSRAVVTLQATLKTRKGEVLTRLFSASVKTKSDDAPGGVAAFNEAMDRLMGEIAAWLISEGRVSSEK
ncbi:ABC-type transport auxiliary lipoprotein family protein [Hydrogenimonas sp. SS33]|uniref:ABC-type transport auxiliary lipoprotein family protein n=1 Tax=Hydrogenimonas leucolamina TaxID=2954236 RepID=UPI00336BB17B